MSLFYFSYEKNVMIIVLQRLLVQKVVSWQPTVGRRAEPTLAKISQETLADMIGTTRSRVSFFMNKFRKLGLIDYNGCIDVHSSLLNVVLHDEPHINT